MPSDPSWPGSSAAPPASTPTPQAPASTTSPSAPNSTPPPPPPPPPTTPPTAPSPPTRPAHTTRSPPPHPPTTPPSSPVSTTAPVNTQLNPQLTPQISDRDLADLRAQLLGLLRMSPTLAEVVASDPTLLANQDYVNRNNPELEKFLMNHPEVARNPDFYLYANLPPHPGTPPAKLMRKTCMDQVHIQHHNAT